MIFSADLHLHSRYSRAVSNQMTLENISRWARRKGVDLIGTGDCLQPAWLNDLETKLVETEPGLFSPRPELEAVTLRQLPPRLQRPLRFVLSTEVHCAPNGTAELGGLHHLLYFRSFASARRMHQRLANYGDLNEGRPRLRLTSRQLLKAAITHGEGCHFAPAHVWNPFFSTFGSQSGAASLDALVTDLAPQVTLAETGLTSIPPMCRRFSPLDRCALFSCSDAHSLENIGRECTLVEIEPDYDALFSALQGRGPGRVVGTIKFPLERTRYYRNRCVRCQSSFDGTRCPLCNSELIQGSRDRLEIMADRREPRLEPGAPPFRMLLPLRYVIAELCQCSLESKAVEPIYQRLLQDVGHERHVLNDATEEEITAATTRQLARTILLQRTVPPGRSPAETSPSARHQLSLFEGEAKAAGSTEEIHADQLGAE
jgi:DNA helicase II / ATP-dependent DNA helicase PcrA